MRESRHDIDSPTVGWILYDASCGVCQRAASKWSVFLQRQGFALRPLQDPWVIEQIKAPAEELMKDMHLLFLDGQRLAGAEVYRFMLRRIWWAYPFYILSILPGLQSLFNWSYRAFANNRHKISQACKL